MEGGRGGWETMRDKHIPVNGFIWAQGSHVFMCVLPKTKCANAGNEGTMKGRMAVMAVENEPRSAKRQLALRRVTAMSRQCVG